MNIKLAKSWDDVTISQWQEISNIQADTDIAKYIETISILADCDPEEIRQMGIREYQSLQKETVYLSEPLKNEVKLKIEIDGKKYGMIPHLDFITAGEWIDAETWKDQPVDNLHLYCALIFRPITKEDGDEYEIEKHKPEGFMRRAELFKNKLSITAVYGSVLFFSSAAVKFMEVLAAYLDQEGKTKKKKIVTKTKTTQKATKKNKKHNSKSRGESTI